MRSQCTTTKSSPRLPQLEKAHAQQQTPNAAKDKNGLQTHERMLNIINH